MLSGPFKTCPSCKKTYINRECREPALLPYKRPSFAKEYFVIILLSLGLGGVVAGSVGGPTDNTVLGFAVGGVVFIAAAVLGCIKEAKVNKDPEKEKSRFYWEQSKARLENPEYVKALLDSEALGPKETVKKVYPQLFELVASSSEDSELKSKEYDENAPSDTTKSEVRNDTTPELFVADELTKLKQLLDAGVLTKEEFAHQKAKLLGNK